MTICPREVYRRTKIYGVTFFVTHLIRSQTMAIMASGDKRRDSS